MWPPKALAYAWGQGRKVLTPSLLASLSRVVPWASLTTPKGKEEMLFTNSYQGPLWTNDAHLTLTPFPTILFFGAPSHDHLLTCASLGSSGTTSPSALFLEPLHQLLQDL